MFIAGTYTVHMLIHCKLLLTEVHVLLIKQCSYCREIFSSDLYHTWLYYQSVEKNFLWIKIRTHSEQLKLQITVTSIHYSITQIPRSILPLVLWDSVKSLDWCLSLFSCPITLICHRLLLARTLRLSAAVLILETLPSPSPVCRFLISECFSTRSARWPSLASMDRNVHINWS